MISLKSSDGETFEIEDVIAAESQTIKHMIEDDCADNTIPLPNVTSKILAKVIEYCRKHVEASAKASGEGAAAIGNAIDEDVKEFDADFVKQELGTLIDIIVAANYLNIKKLLEFMFETIADKIKDKTVEDIRQIFNIENDFSPEEEAAMRKENSWAFE